MNPISFDISRRLRLDDQQYTTLTSCGWLSVMYNVLHAAQDPEEAVIAAFTLRRYIGVVGGSSTADTALKDAKFVVQATTASNVAGTEFTVNTVTR